jgi:protein-tyrosine phosphatase
LLRSIDAALNEGKTVGVHCRQGIGRSGLIAAGVLVASGAGLDKAIDAVSTARGEPVPETREQLHWLEQRASEILVAAS